MNENIYKIDLSKYDSSFSIRNKLGRVLWNVVFWLAFRPFNLAVFHPWRAFILKLFGAKLGKGVIVYASVNIWAPWNLEMGDYSVLGPRVDCYNQGKITIGKQSNISQKTYLCASSHDFTISTFPLILCPIVIQDQVWIAADAFIGPNVFIGEGAVVGARAAVFKKVAPWTVVGGNPAVYIKDRIVQPSKNIRQYVI